jgi:DNA repair protein RecO (recombination protein O)
VKVELQSGYVLHTRPWRDSSLIVEYFSRDQGRLPLVARGAKSRKQRGGSAAALLQPFTPLQVSWSGRGSLKTLTGCEALGPALSLTGRILYSGLYLNELLTRLLQHEDPHHRLFNHYAVTLTRLAEEEDEELPLRRFELVLLEELGYGFDLSCDGISGQAIAEDAWYHYNDQHGLIMAPDTGGERLPRFLGSDLARISRGDFSGSARLCAKRLLRQALTSHLGERPLMSRELFRSH